ncbi:sugar ABC transporter [Burkholderia sp. Bp9143]|uniref:sugar ABC transporter n=1 Tax=Burkholderia sp. Bp9143 TaxID=2184574 RepID=UPI000F5B13FF|nr:sugar ABC transporter [Burkholderia sp. Bp9143]RQR25519.1 sugar ABC transporter [Burkholderia sp. Bp9143]
MIYAVECSIAEPAVEAEWNDFYSRVKLPALISVSGFRTSQRFRALDGDGDGPVYLALHTIDGPDVLTSDEYRDKGGGNFARWQPHIVAWRRNVYDSATPAPAVSGHQWLAVCDDDAPFARAGIAAMAMQAVALDRLPATRWLAVLDRDQARLASGTATRRYAPMGDRLVSTPPSATAR